MIHSRDDTGGDAEKRRQDRSAHCNRERIGKPLQDLFQNRHAHPDRRTEIAVESSDKKAPVLLVERLIQAEIPAYLLHNLGPGFEPGNKKRRVAGDHVDHEEHEDRRPQEREEHFDETAGNVTRHDMSVRQAREARA